MVDITDVVELIGTYICAQLSCCMQWAASSKGLLRATNFTTVHLPTVRWKCLTD